MVPAWGTTVGTPTTFRIGAARAPMVSADTETTAVTRASGTTVQAGDVCCLLSQYISDRSMPPAFTSAARISRAVFSLTPAMSASFGTDVVVCHPRFR